MQEYKPPRKAKSGQAEGSQQDEAQRASLGILGNNGEQEWVFPVVT